MVKLTQLKFLKSNVMGIILGLISSVLVSLANLLVFGMTHFHPIPKSSWRFAGIFLPSIFVVVYYSTQEKSITSSFWPLRRHSFIVVVSLAFRCLFGCTAAILQYYSLEYMPLGDSTVIYNSYPIFVAILAFLFLREPFGGLFMILSMLFTFAGVVMIARPPFITGETLNSALLIGAALAISCAISNAGDHTMIRALNKIHLHHCIQLISFGFFGTIQSILLAWSIGVMAIPSETNDILKAIAIGMLSFGGQIFLILALNCGDAGPVALAKSSTVLFSFVWQMVFMQVFPDIITVTGAIVMMSGILLCGFKNYIDSLEDTHSMKKTLRFMTK